MRAFTCLAALALVACSQQPDEAAPADEASVPATPERSATLPPDAQPGEKASAAPVLALDGEGLRLVDAKGATKLVAFGSDAATAEGLLPKVGERMTNEECGAGPMQFARDGGLTLNFQDGKFVGWYLEEGSDLTTMDGIGLGSTRAGIEQTRTLEMLEGSTLGDEFALGTLEDAEIFGFLDGKGTSAKVTALYAGTNCFFR